MRRRITGFLLTVQFILLMAHAFVYETWATLHASAAGSHTGISKLGAAMALLAMTFVSASVLARYSRNFLARWYYRAAAVWLGFLSFFFLASAASWLAYAFAKIAKIAWQPQTIADVFFAAALLAGLYGLLNASQVRVKQVMVKLPNLPASWRGRVAALVTDLHLGHVNGYRFAERIVAKLAQFHPDIVLIAGDMYDGTLADARKLAEPLEKISAPLGAYFIEGNHEEFGGRLRYIDALEKSGVRVLDGEKVVVDEMQIVGVHYKDTVNPQKYRALLKKAEVNPAQASILLTHAPHNLAIAEEEKIGLQLAGHTHGGQFFPFTWITSRIWGPFVYGLKGLGNLLVYTSCGAGTWGPPMRVGTNPEIVMIGFE